MTPEIEIAGSIRQAADRRVRPAAASVIPALTQCDLRRHPATRIRFLPVRLTTVRGDTRQFANVLAVYSLSSLSLILAKKGMIRVETHSYLCA